MRETGDWKVELARDDRSPSITGGKAVIRRHYRFQVQGPNAARILRSLNGGPIPDVKFFHMDAINIKGRKVRALRHGMAGAPGLEVWGPYEQDEEIRDGDHRSGRRISGWCRSAPAHTPPTRWSRAGFLRRCPRCTRARR